MAHELDITNGVASFANSRTDAWHRLGQSVGHAMTAREALDAAHLSNWNVRKMPLRHPAGARHHRRRRDHPGAHRGARPVRHRSRQPHRRGPHRLPRRSRQQIRARAKRGIVRAARRAHRRVRRRLRDRRGPARRPRNLRDHEAAEVDDLRRPRRIERPHRLVSGSAQFSHDGYLPLAEMRRHLWMEGSLWTHRAAIRPLSATCVTFDR